MPLKIASFVGSVVLVCAMMTLPALMGYIFGNFLGAMLGFAVGCIIFVFSLDYIHKLLLKVYTDCPEIKGTTTTKSDSLN